MIPSGILFRVSTAYNRLNVYLDLRTVDDVNRFNLAAAKPLLLYPASSLNFPLELCNLGLEC